MDIKERYGPWAVISGASEGTGKAFAHLLASKGIHCLLIARREAPLEELADDLTRQYGIETVIAAIDLARPDACDRMMTAVGDREVGLFVSNAGSDPNAARFLEQDLSAWVDLVERNVTTMMKCSYHLAAPMKARGRGGVLLVNSGACYGGSTAMGTYSGSKAFTLCFAEGLWAELRPHGVDVLTLVMSRTDTPEFRRVLAQQGVPVPDNIASPDDVARLGLERLPHGPICNWGEADDESGMSATSAAQRRERVVMIDKVTSQLFGRS
ncbi:short-subunit dehydrogenase [Novosphingobium sp. PhB165]|uniref:SDR family NAD(P)-dependent oxidoreductase n=1 Tax=Novosphingobium sp. PhB165 TaxID=2485105 RepID=UPI0010458C27|nr:SDR family NAD(P)-dependent oxidoreductase [Novosphingobium sp. PhB165]TCM20910.1 short-subunit dehydrogenase [Novosphingobium sp. PhB165]